MNAAAVSQFDSLRPRILERRARLEAAAAAVSAGYLNELLAEVDAALHRIDTGSFGICESCHESIEAEDLECNPLLRFCIDHLNAAQRKAHEQDMELATEIQSKLLPPCDVAFTGWDAHYRYQPAGAVGGDYCELIPAANGKSLFFAVGDVTGKGVAASLLMTHLSAIFRSLLSLELPLVEVVWRANRLLCDATASAHYATLACGLISAEGVELCNAGHCGPLLLRCGGVAETIDSTGLPLGLFCGGLYSTRHVRIGDGDSLVLYSDGITETEGGDGCQYGEDRLIRTLLDHADQGARVMAEGVLRDVAGYRAGARPHDDITLLIVRRHC